MHIGFDLGGTKMLAAILDDNGAIVARAKDRSTSRGNDKIVSQVIDTIDAALKKASISRSDIATIGIAAPGPIDIRTGTILETPNLGIRDLPLSKRISEEIGCPVTLENDVNAGLWGEFVAGAARGMSHVVGLFPGTGIGGAMILDGVLYHGRDGSAGEIGHITVQSDGRRCGCGNHGCLEAVASKTAIARDLAMLAATGQSPILSEAGASDITKVRSGLILRAMEAGDEGVIAVVNQAAEWLGIGMAAMVNVFNPEMIVLGGGLIEKLGSRFTDIAKATMRVRAMRRLTDGVQVVEAACGDDAAVIGASDQARRAHEARTTGGTTSA